MLYLSNIIFEKMFFNIHLHFVTLSVLFNKFYLVMKSLKVVEFFYGQQKNMFEDVPYVWFIQIYLSSNVKEESLLSSNTLKYVPGSNQY